MVSTSLRVCVQVVGRVYKSWVVFTSCRWCVKSWGGVQVVGGVYKSWVCVQVVGGVYKSWGGGCTSCGGGVQVVGGVYKSWGGGGVQVVGVCTSRG